MAELPSDQINRLEQYLNYLATGSGEIPSEPQNRLEQYLEYLCENGGGGGLPDPTLLPAGSVLVGDGAEWKPQDGYGYTGKQFTFETSGYGPSYTPVTPPHPELTYKPLHSTTLTTINFTPMSVVYNWDGSEHPFTFDNTLGYYVFDEGFIHDWGASLNVWVQENVLPEDESARTVKVYENALHQIDPKYIPGAKQMFSLLIWNMGTGFYIDFPDAPNFIRAVNADGMEKVGIYNAISISDGPYDMASLNYTINVAILLQTNDGELMVYTFNMSRNPDAPNFHQIGHFKTSDLLPSPGVDGTGLVSIGGKWVKQTGYPIDAEITRNTAAAGSPEGEYTPFTMSEYELSYTPSSIKYSWDGSIHEVTKNSQGALSFDDGYILEYPAMAFMYWKVMVKTSAIPSYVTFASVTVQERTLKKLDPSFVPWPPYKSLRRLASYAYEVTFDTIPEDTDANLFTASGCSSVVSNGRLYSNLDWKYNNNVIFHVKCNGFEGMAFSDRLTEGALDDDLIGQLPYHIRDGRNDAGIMVATHVVYNDLAWSGASSGALFTRIPITKLPYKVLTEVSDMSAFESWCTANLPAFYDGWLGRLETYALQFIVTDGTTTYVITMTGRPPFASLVCVNATNNPKLTNFYWINQSTISSRSSLSQEHPTGIERWNALRTWGVPDMAGIRFTQSYERTDRLSDFIGESGTTKDSTDEELLAIRDLAYAAYQNRTRNGETWQTVYSVVYSPNKLETLYIQEDFETKVIGESIEFDLNSATAGDLLMVASNKRIGYESRQAFVEAYPESSVGLQYSNGQLHVLNEDITLEELAKFLRPGTRILVFDQSFDKIGEAAVFGYWEQNVDGPFLPRTWAVRFNPHDDTIIEGLITLSPNIVDDELVGGRITYRPLPSDHSDYVFAMPRKIYLGPSEQDAIKLYFDSMIPQRYTPRVGNYSSICEMRLTEDYLKLVPGTIGTKGIDSYVYDEQMNLVDSHSNTEHYYDVVVSHQPPFSQFMLLIGDSFIEQGYIAPDLRGLFTADGNVLHLVGTKGSGDDKHEGYAGKSAVDFASGFPGSPFGESGFDFGSYVTSHGYGDVLNSVYIQLGTNDVSAGSIMSDAQIDAVISAFDTIVGSIRAYDGAMRIVLGTTVGCTADTAKFSEAYYGNGEREIMQQNMRKLAAAIIDHFAGTDYLRVAPVVGILDPTEDFHNSVHPNAGGYAKMAKCVYDTMRQF